MIYKRPDYLLQPQTAPARTRRTSALAGLGELGTLLSGATGALSQFKKMCEDKIAAHFGPIALSNVQSTPDLGGTIGLCAALVLLGEGGNLPPDQQAYWNDWKAVASPLDSEHSTEWMFAKQLQMSKDRLLAAMNAQADTNWWSDADASLCNFTLLDTSQTGTNWYGGEVVTSKLSPDQWATIFSKAWSVLMNGIANGVLPLSYLTAMLQGMLLPLTQRRMIAYYPAPSGMDSQDPRAIAFRAAMKQIGWSDVVKLWYNYTAQAWAEENAAFESQDRMYAGAITALSYVSGKAILDKIVAKAGEYFRARSEAVQALNDFNQLVTGPLAENVPQEDRDVMAALRQQFQENDGKAMDSLRPIGLWDDGQQQLNGLGAVQMIVAGIVAIGVLGVLAYVVSMMTETARSAAAQTKKTADNILATVDAVKASCIRVYQESEKTAEDETRYQECLLQTKALTDSIPKPPEGNDPLGLGKLAMLAGVGLAAFLAIKLMGKKGGGSAAPAKA